MTCLANLDHVSKNHQRIHAVGDADELNSVLGLAISFCDDQELCDQLTHIQSWLFVIGAELACAPNSTAGESGNPRATSILESWIDEYTEKSSPLQAFILPGGTPVSAHLHQARSICRRLERTVVGLGENQEVKPELLIFLNRLSDYLFASARFAAQRTDSRTQTEAPTS